MQYCSHLIHTPLVIHTLLTILLLCHCCANAKDPAVLSMSIVLVLRRVERLMAPLVSSLDSILVSFTISVFNVLNVFNAAGVEAEAGADAQKGCPQYCLSPSLFPSTSVGHGALDVAREWVPARQAFPA